jgi:uncharacterized protein (TIGR03437 family)
MRMKAACLLAALVIGPLPAETSGPPGTPNYSAASIANSAANVADLYAPNTFVSIYGQNLSFTTQAIGPDDIRAGMLPNVLLGSGVRVLLNLMPANMYFVSPNQVNILIPPSLVPGKVTLQLVNDAHAGPPVDLMLEATAPALFEYEDRVIATHLDGSLLNSVSPGRGGEVIVLWATGLGPTAPAAIPNRIPGEARWLANFDNFQVVLNAVPVAPRDILYAGVAPGFAGLFQINVRLPEAVPSDPEVRVGSSIRLSPPGRILSAR